MNKECNCQAQSIYFTWVCKVHGSMTRTEYEKKGYDLPPLSVRGPIIDLSDPKFIGMYRGRFKK